MKDLIVLYGKKQSGKTTSATAIYGYYLTQKGVLPNAEFDEDGQMSVVYNKEKNEGIIFDIDSREDYMLDFYAKNVWPHIKHQSFADALKQSCINLFSLNPKLIYGTNEDKNQNTHILWSDLSALIPEHSVRYQELKNKTGYVTHRELLEVFGTEICRTIDSLCHIRSAYTQLQRTNPTIGIIPDGRFMNEFDFFYKLKHQKKNGTKVHLIKHKRSVFQSTAQSEQEIENIPDEKFDLVVPPEMNIVDKNKFVINFLIKNKVLNSSGVQIY